jgi:hypothetical protein
LYFIDAGPYNLVARTDASFVIVLTHNHDSENQNFAKSLLQPGDNFEQQSFSAKAKL